MKKITTPRAKPNLTRKRIVVQNTPAIKVVVKPSKAQIVDINRVKHTKVTQPIQICSSPLLPTAKVVVPKRQFTRSQPKPKKHKSISPRYVTKKVDEVFIHKLRDIKNIGINRILVIVANGPSVNECPLQKLKHPRIDILSINRPDHRIWPTKFWAFFDPSQLKRNIELFENYEGFIFNSPSIKRIKPKTIQVQNIMGKGFNRDLTQGIYIGNSSTHAAMQLALWMNYDEVYLFGVDMNPAGLNGKLHFYGNNPDVNLDKRKAKFAKEANNYSYSASILNADERRRFIFCTEYNPWPFVNEFRHMSHRQAVEFILDKVEKT